MHVTVVDPLCSHEEVNNNRFKSISTPSLQRNGDFALIFFNFVILPLQFQNEDRLYPDLLSPSNGVKFWINGQRYPWSIKSLNFCATYPELKI